LSVPAKFGNPFRHETQTFEEENKRKRWKTKGRKKNEKKDKKEKDGSKEDNKLVIVTATNKQRRPCFHINLHPASFAGGTHIISILSLVVSVFVVKFLTV
jgi:hypothetical protein